ncbi:MAG: type I restriction endonuclease subunit R [Nitrosomonas sp.]|nr:type I restriction endonuclease subunit R [Nitrosomonas sp.]
MTEDDLEQLCIKWMLELGYDYRHGEEISPGGLAPERTKYAETILTGRLKAALLRLNKSLPASSIDDALRLVTNYAGTSLIESNRELYSWIRDGIPVEVNIDGHKQRQFVQVVHWTDPTQNDWLVVNQFTVKGKKTDRPDLVVFLNGLPISIIELKNPADETADVSKAFNQIKNYQNEISQLFEPSAVNIISDGTVARIGSITANSERFMPWRVASGIEDPAKHLELEVMIRGVFEKKTFLTYLRHFILFQTVSGSTFKVTAGYHQFYGVLKAVDRAVEAVTLKHDGLGGVMWFTQGSGKSFIAVFYVGMLREIPAMENPTIVVVTDRKDLDGQLYETFAASYDKLQTKPVQAEDHEHLRKILGEQVAGGIFFTTIQKFKPKQPGSRLEAISQRRNIIVICDEAHRTQYGFIATIDGKTGITRYGLATHMRDAFPNATFLGLTGTPISANDKDTQGVFGTYVDVYDVIASQQDNTTVPIHYESRVIDLAYNEKVEPELDAELEELTEDDDPEMRAKAISRLARLESVAMADNRLGKLAADLVEHWEHRLEVLDGKGMIVAISRKAAVVLYAEIIKLRPQWHSDDINTGVIKVVMTSRASDSPDLRIHSTTDAEKKLLEKRLKDPDDELKLVIVRDMWLTGFDAPCLHTLYVDKPMQGHGLMQAIARVNRVWKDKPGGLVVDYIGFGPELKQAIAQYTNAGKKTIPPVNFIDEVLVILKDTLQVIRDMFHGFDYSTFVNSPHHALKLLPQAMEHIVSFDNEDDGHGRNRGVKRFLDQVAKLTKTQALAGTHPEALAVREEIAFLQAVRSALVKHTKTNVGLNEVEKEAALRQLVSKGVLVGAVTDLYKTLGLERPDISVLDEHFLDEVAKLPQRNLAAELLQRLIDNEIRSRGRKNTTQQALFSSKLEEAIARYRARALTTQQVIEELIKIAKELNAARPPDDMSTDEFAFYEALAQNESAREVMGIPVLRALAHELTDKLRKSATVDWSKRQSAREKMKVLVKVLLGKYRYPPDRQPEAINKVIEQAELFADEWAIEQP